MTGPNTRAFHQTNFSEGEFVRKVPFLLFFLFTFFYFLLPLLFSFSNVLMPFFQMGPRPFGVST